MAGFSKLTLPNTETLARQGAQQDLVSFIAGDPGLAQKAVNALQFTPNPKTSEPAIQAGSGLDLQEELRNLMTEAGFDEDTISKIFQTTELVGRGQ